MNNKPKTAFLILRVTKDFKIRLVKKAKNKGKSLSEFLREFIEKI